MVFLVVAIVYNFVILAKMWGPLQDGVNPITVGKAIGFLFIPVFSAYWIFRAWGSYPTEYNNFLQRHGLAAPPLVTRVFWAFPVGLLLQALLLPALFLPPVFAILVARVCDAVNNLETARRNGAEGRYASQADFIPQQPTRAPFYLAGGIAAVMVSVLSLAGLAYWNLNPSISETEVPAKVGDFARTGPGRSYGTVLGLRTRSYADYQPPASGGEKILNYTIERFFTAGMAENRSVWFSDPCSSETSARKSEIKDSSGKVAGFLNVCDRGVGMRNGRYQIEIRSSYMSKGPKITEAEFLQFAKGLPINAGFSFGDLVATKPAAPSSSPTAPSNTGASSITADTPADFTMTVEDFAAENDGTKEKAAIAKFRNKVIELSGRVSNVGSIHPDRINFRTEKYLAARAAPNTQPFSGVKNDTRVKVKCLAAGDYSLALENCILLEDNGVISPTDTPDFTHTAKEYYDLLSSLKLSTEVSMRNHKKYAGKIVKLTGTVDTISGQNHHMNAGGATDFITCRPDPENEGMFAALTDGQSATFMGVVGLTATLDHCLVIQ